MEGYETFFALYKKYNLEEYGIRRDYKKIRKLIENKEIDGKIVNGKIYVSVQSLELYMGKIDTIRNEYMPIEEFVFNLTGKTNYISIPVIREFAEKTCIEFLVLDIPITRTDRYFIKKSSYYQFLNDYISLTDAFEKYKSTPDVRAFRGYLVNQGIEIVIFQKFYDFQYVKKEDLESIQDKINVKEVMVELGVLKHNFYEIMKLYNIKIFRGTRNDGYNQTFMSKKDFQFLKDLQLKTLKDLKENTYTYEELVQLYNEIGAVSPYEKVLKDFAVPDGIPLIVRTEKYRAKMTLYYKNGVDKYIENLKKEKEISRICSFTTTDYYQLLLQIIEIDNVDFSENARITKSLWFQFAKWRLRNMSGNDETCKSRVIGFRQSTRLLSDLTSSKEIHEFSEKELNLSIFNKNVQMTYQKEIYSFLHNMSQTVEQKSGKRLFNLSKLNFKNIKGDTLTKKQKDIYSVEEYLGLYRYVKDYELHKLNAVDSVKKALRNRNLSKNKEYKKYESMWLYVLLHLCNGWRNSTVLEFPRFPSELFDNLNLNSIESLDDLKLTYTEAEKIVKNYQLQWFEHNKNKEKATFYCSSELTIPMAYAILICEFRCRNLHLHGEPNLIHFYNSRNQVSSTIHDSFFSKYREGFKFQSRKMNSTVLVYTSSVIESTFGDPIEIAQHLRGHTTAETTNVYYQIPQEHLDFITEQLFDTGYFGFIYNKINTLLIGESPKTRVEQTKQSIEIKELLGDVVKLEDMTSYLNQISQEQHDLGVYLEKLPKDELKKKLNLINLGLSPAREESYQCFFADCIAKEIECNKCPFSIPNFYSLTTICKRIKRILYRYQTMINDSDVPIGEKTKLFNLLLKDYNRLYEAKQRFGVEIIELFIDHDMNQFLEQFHLLPEPEIQYLD